MPATALKVAKFVFAGLPVTAALVSVQIAPVMTQLPPAGSVSVIKVAVLRLVNIAVPADTKVFEAVVATAVNVPPLLVVKENVAGLLTPVVPAPLVLFLMVNDAGGTMMSSAVLVAPLKDVIVAPVAAVVAFALLL